LNAMLGNCIFYISPMYEFSHSLDPTATLRSRITARSSVNVADMPYAAMPKF
jgi:hypothetical protein